MALEFALVVLQVGAAILLGAFYGLERKVRGYPDASGVHALTAAFGLVCMIAFRPEDTSILQTTSALLIIAVAFVAGVRSAMKSIALRDDLFAGSGADTFTLSGAMAVGAACGTGDVRAVAAVVLITTLIGILRPLEEKPLQAAATANDNGQSDQLLYFVPRDSSAATTTDVSAPNSSRDNGDGDTPKAA